MKKKKKDYHHKKVFVVFVDMFRIDVAFCINMNEKEMRQWLKRQNKTTEDNLDKKAFEDWEKSSSEGRMLKLDRGFLVAIKAKDNQYRRFVGTLVHECTHVAHYLLRDRQIPLSEDTEEVYTYLIQHLVEESLKKSW